MLCDFPGDDFDDYAENMMSPWSKDNHPRREFTDKEVLAYCRPISVKIGISMSRSSVYLPGYSPPKMTARDPTTCHFQLRDMCDTIRYNITHET